METLGYILGIAISIRCVVMVYGSFVLAWKRANEHPTTFAKCWKVTMIIYLIFIVIGIISNAASNF